MERATEYSSCCRRRVIARELLPVRAWCSEGAGAGSVLGEADKEISQWRRVWSQVEREDRHEEAERSPSGLGGGVEGGLRSRTWADISLAWTLQAADQS